MIEELTLRQAVRGRSVQDRAPETAMQKHRTTRERNGGRPRTGVALILVLFVISFATVMGFALLSSASLQVNISANAVHAAQARYLAESGLNLGVYYLLHPEQSPKSASDRFWSGGTSIGLGSAVNGTFDIAITPSDASAPYPPRFTLSATGRAIGPSGSATTHTATAVVEMDYDFHMPAAAGFNTNIAIPAGVRFNGNVLSNGTITMNSLSRIDGNVQAVSLLGGVLNGLFTPIVAGTLEVPSSGNIQFSAYTPTYEYNGQTYNAVQLAAGTWTETTLSPDPLTNPGGIFYVTSDVFLNGSVTINGTLVVRGGRLRYARGGNSITPVSGFPALLVDNDLQVAGTNAALTVNGLVWVCKGLTQITPNTGSSLTINGALILDPAATWYAVASGMTVLINHVPANLNVPDFSTVSLRPRAVKPLSWSIDKRSNP
jgi:Tfp pilus assembly protein PilX